MQQYRNENTGQPVSAAFQNNIQLMYKQLAEKTSTVIKLMFTDPTFALINTDDFRAIVAFQNMFPHLFSHHKNPKLIRILPPAQNIKPSDYAFQIAAFHKAYHSPSHGHIFQRLLNPQYLHNIMISRNNLSKWECSLAKQTQQSTTKDAQPKQLAQHPQQERGQLQPRGQPKPREVARSDADHEHAKRLAFASSSKTARAVRTDTADKNWANFYEQDPVKAMAAGYTKTNYDAYLRKKTATVSAGGLSVLEKLQRMQQTIDVDLDQSLSSE